MDMKKEWKEIKGYEGKYIVSNYGEVISLPRLKQNNSKKQYVEPKELSKHISSTNGYVYVLLCGKGKCKNVRLHKLVAEAFIPNPEHKEQVNHIDGNKRNNCVNNLEWCTQDENMAHSYKIGLRDKSKMAENMRQLGRNSKGKQGHHIRNILQIDKETNKVLREWRCILDASKELNISNTSIQNACTKRSKTAGGYKWKYKEDKDE